MTTERGAATRQRLLDAAVTVFSQRGYARATTRDIARAAGVAEGTIYRHFSDKQELFREALMTRSPEVAEGALRLPELAGQGTVPDNLRQFITVIEDIERTIAPLQASVWSDEELAKMLAASMDAVRVPAQVLRPLAAYLAAEKELGRIRGDVDCERAAFALFAIPFAAVMTSRMSRSAGAAQDLDIMGSIDVLLSGILP